LGKRAEKPAFSIEEIGIKNLFVILSWVAKDLPVAGCQMKILRCVQQDE